MLQVLQSLWGRYGPGADPIARHIRYNQWTAIHLHQAQLDAGVIPLRHIASLLRVDRPEGMVWVIVDGRHIQAERMCDCLVVPPGLLDQCLVMVKQSAEGYRLLPHARPNLLATQQLVSALTHAGWDCVHDPFDQEGKEVIPALLRATAVDSTLRHQPTLPLDLIQQMQINQVPLTFR